MITSALWETDEDLCADVIDDEMLRLRKHHLI